MAGLNIHFVIAKRYIAKNKNILNEHEFYQGNLDPDLAQDKEKSHYSGVQFKGNLVEYLKNKVLLNKYLDENSIDSDYDKGIFLHLVTDYIWFNEFFDKEYINKVYYQDFVKDLYYSYAFTNPYIDKKYEMDYSEFREVMDKVISNAKKNRGYHDEEGNNIIPVDKLCEFIEFVSSINLDEYAKKIMIAGKNVMP